MARTAALLAVLVWSLGAACWAQGATGTVARINGPVIEVRLPAGTDVKVRDVYVLKHGARTLGEAMVTAVTPHVTLVPKGSAAPTVGDTVEFVRRPALPSGGLEGWSDVNDPREGFRIKLPGAAKRDTSGYNTTVGAGTKRTYTAERDHVKFEVIVIDYDRIHQNGEKDYLKGDIGTVVWPGSTVVWKRPVELSGVTGIDVEARGFKGVPIRARVFHRGMRAWVVYAQAEADHDLTGDVPAFLESFHFVP